MDEVLLRPEQVRAEDIDPHYRWNRALPALGPMVVDFEERVDCQRLHRYRLGRARQALDASKLGALLCFDVNNIRYVTSTKIGEWERDKLCRFALLARGGEPMLWDFGSAAVHHRLYVPWLRPELCKAGLVGLRGTVPPAFGLMRRHAEEIAGLLRDAGVADMPLGVDIIEPPMMFELERAGLKVADGQQVTLDAREIKSIDEIALLNRAAAMVDGVYQLISEELKPGVRDADKQCRDWLDRSIELIRPGVTTDTVASVWPRADEFGFPDEMSAFGLQFGHGLGLALHERPIISRLVSLEHPLEIKEGMVFALETYCPASDGYSAARIEEEVVVTDKGCRIISLFPAEELPIANKY